MTGSDCGSGGEGEITIGVGGGTHSGGPPFVGKILLAWLLL